MTREDLKNYRNSEDWIKGRIEYIKEYQESITSIQNILSDMPKSKSPYQDKIAEKLATLYEYVDEVLDKVLIQQDQQVKLLNLIGKIEYPYKLILEKEFIQGKTLVTVASEMGYSYERMKHMNGIALLKFDELEEDK